MWTLGRHTLGAVLFLMLAVYGPSYADGATKPGQGSQDKTKAAQTTDAKPIVVRPVIDPDKEKAIRKLLDLTGSSKIGMQIAQQMIATFRSSQSSVPDEFWVEFSKKIKPDDLINMIIPIYDKHYSKEDLEGLTTFYESPLGQKVIASIPQITSESMQVGQQWGEALGKEVVQELQKRYGQQDKADKKAPASKTTGKPKKP